MYIRTYTREVVCSHIISVELNILINHLNTYTYLRCYPIYKVSMYLHSKMHTYRRLCTLNCHGDVCMYACMHLYKLIRMYTTYVCHHGNVCCLFSITVRVHRARDNITPLSLVSRYRWSAYMIKNEPHWRQHPHIYTHTYV